MVSGNNSLFFDMISSIKGDDFWVYFISVGFWEDLPSLTHSERTKNIKKIDIRQLLNFALEIMGDIFEIKFLVYLILIV
jgi:hypothetical protein